MFIITDQVEGEDRTDERGGEENAKELKDDFQGEESVPNRKGVK